MPRTRAIVTGALISTLLTGCVSADGDASPSTSTRQPSPSVSASRPQPARPSSLLPTPAQDPCALISEARASEITSEELFRRPESPYYMPDQLRDAEEPAYWVCHTSFHRLAKPREGLAVLTYDTTTVAAATRKYDEVVAFYTQQEYYQPRAGQGQLQVKGGAERTVLLAFEPNELDGYNGYGGVVVLSHKTVFTVLWTTKSLAVLKALAEEAVTAVGK